MSARALLVALTLTVAAGCDPTLSDADRATFAAWFECEDCMHGQLDSVLYLGPKALTPLLRILRFGPPESRRAAERRAALAQYAGAWQDPAAANGHPDEKARQFASRMVGQYVVRYRIRAAEALGRLGDRYAVPSLRAVRDDHASAPALRYATAEAVTLLGGP